MPKRLVGLQNIADALFELLHLAEALPAHQSSVTEK
jgi:hypothetical protein